MRVGAPGIYRGALKGDWWVRCCRRGAKGLRGLEGWAKVRGGEGAGLGMRVTFARQAAAEERTLCSQLELGVAVRPADRSVAPLDT